MTKKRVGILTTYHLHNDGQRIIYGGAERYGVEFTKLLLELGYNVAWWQIGSGWEQEIIPGVPLLSIPIGKSDYQTCPTLNQAFHEQAEQIDYAIYFSTLLAYPQAYPKSISISHGIYWDYSIWDSIIPTEHERTEWRYRWYCAINRPTKVVSCDTATIRFINATWPGLGNKLEYIPNFVDLNCFYPNQSATSPGKIKVLFPRRLTSVRGINETIAAAEYLTAKYPQVEFHIVGRGHTDFQERDLLKWASNFENIYYYWQPPHQMAGVYRKADIVLIPTKASEGTSLSCLEAMASGKAVIAGCVGGLTDLIIDGYNGLLLRPLNTRTLIKALELLINERDFATKLGKQAQLTAEAFSLGRWKARWAKVIMQIFS
ncbi:MAG TPA: glycosyltransferase family 4 protein [Bacillota bacterium]|jgi:glycosyltransferase involved in cell wall biosynthesis|nr:glycosyltransferase family 4 protein [Bacillota bacterium]HOL10586.1 glycosyltransferase family 4 protein [Bacillota bacterium]HPO98288.1 glycosyltransferase family 4 protein [Bacillota bacterium]